MERGGKKETGESPGPKFPDRCDALSWVVLSSRCRCHVSAFRFVSPIKLSLKFEALVLMVCLPMIIILFMAQTKSNPEKEVPEDPTEMPCTRNLCWSCGHKVRCHVGQVWPGGKLREPWTWAFAQGTSREKRFAGMATICQPAVVTAELNSNEDYSRSACCSVPFALGKQTQSHSGPMGFPSSDPPREEAEVQRRAIGVGQ